MNQEMKQIFLNTITGEAVVGALQKKYLTLSDLSQKHVQSAIDFCLESKKKIPQRFVTRTDDHYFRQLISKDEFSQVEGSVPYGQLYQEFLRRLNQGLVIESFDIKAPLSPEVANAISHLVINAPNDCTYNHWRDKRELFPQEVWEKILAARRWGIKQHKVKKYSCLLEEGIMKNDYSIIINARKEPSDISRQEWDAWKKVWFQTIPPVKAFILKTPFFSSLSPKEQQNLLVDISPTLCDFSFVNDKLQPRNCRISRSLLENLSPEVTYNLVLLEMYDSDCALVVPPYSHQELSQRLTSMVLAHPSKVTSMLQAYKILEVIREQKEKRESGFSPRALAYDPDVYFAINVIKKNSWQYALDSESLSLTWKIYHVIDSHFTETQKEVALAAFADLKNRCWVHDYVLKT